MRLSFYTYSYTDRLEMPIEMCHQRIAEAGYSGIDVSGTHGRSEDPRSVDAERRRETRRTTGELNLRVEGVITHAPLTETLLDPDHPTLDLNGTADLAQEIGGEVVTFHMGGYPDGHDPDMVWRKTVAAIKEANDYAADRNVCLAVDGIWPGWINDSPEALQRLFDDVGSDRFGVNFDPCYLTVMGVDPVDFVKQFHERIVHGHIKDFNGVFKKWTHLIPGQGAMDYQRVLAALAEAKFEHALAVECFTEMALEEACDTAYAGMTDAAQKANTEFDR